MKEVLGVILASLLVFAAGCKQTEKVAATVGKEKIGLSTVSQKFNELYPEYQALFSTPEGKKQFLDILVKDRLAVEGARQAGIQKREEYKKQLSEFKTMQEKALKEYEEKLLTGLYQKDLEATEFKVTDEDVNKYYQDHRDAYAKPQTLVKARHILVPSKEEADAVMARLKAGEDFAKLASEVSRDRMSAVRGGEIGFFGEGDLLPEFEKAVMPLKIGEMSGVVQTKYGYNIILKTDEKLGPVPTEEIAKAKIRQSLYKERLDRWVENTRRKIGVKVNYDVLAELNTAPAKKAADAASPAAGGTLETGNSGK